MPFPDKVEAIKNIVVPTTKKKWQHFIGLSNYYKDMWKQRSGILSPLSSMTSKQARWNWSKEYQKAFDSIERLVSKETLLSYPNFNDAFSNPYKCK